MGVLCEQDMLDVVFLQTESFLFIDFDAMLLKTAFFPTVRQFLLDFFAIFLSGQVFF